MITSLFRYVRRVRDYFFFLAAFFLAFFFGAAFFLASLLLSYLLFGSLLLWSSFLLWQLSFWQPFFFGAAFFLAVFFLATFFLAAFFGAAFFLAVFFAAFFLATDSSLNKSTDGRLTTVTGLQKNHRQDQPFKKIHHATKAMVTQIPFMSDDRREDCCRASSFATMLQCNTTESAVNVRAEYYLMFQFVQ